MLNVQVSTMKAAMQFHPDYTKVKAPSLAIYADPNIPESPGKLDAETTAKLAAWWKEHESPKAVASIEQFPQRHEKRAVSRNNRRHALCLRWGNSKIM